MLKVSFLDFVPVGFFGSPWLNKDLLSLKCNTDLNLIPIVSAIRSCSSPLPPCRSANGLVPSSPVTAGHLLFFLFFADFRCISRCKYSRILCHLCMVKEWPRQRVAKTIVMIRSGVLRNSDLMLIVGRQLAGLRCLGI